MSIPAVIGDELFGQIALANSEKDYNDTELDAIKRLARLYALALQRHRIENALQESENKFKKLFNSINDGIFIHDLNAKMLDCNNPAFLNLGYSKDELLSLKVMDVDNPENAEKVAERIAMLQEQGKLIFESTHVRNDGSLMPVEVSSTLMEYGSMPTILSIARNITDRKRTEDALKESVERFRGIVERNFDGIVTIDLEGRVTYISPAVERTLGYKSEEVIGKHFEKFVPESNIPKATQALTEVQEKGSSQGVEVKLLKKDGSSIIVESNSSPILKDGVVVGFQGIYRDITGRKCIEEELKKRLNYEQLLSEISSSAIMVKDLDKFQDGCIKVMAKILDVDRIYIFEHNHETNTMDNTFEWIAPGITAQKDNLQGIRAEEIPWWMEMLKNNRVINYKDIEEIPREKEREILRAQNIVSILVVPLFVAGKYYGFMGFDECRTQREWPKEDTELLQSASRIITGTIERKLADEEIGRRNRELTALNVIATTINQSINQNEILNAVLNEVLELLDLDVGGIYLADTVNYKLDLAAHQGVSQQYVQQVSSPRVSEKSFELGRAKGKLKRFVLSIQAIIKDRSQLRCLLATMKEEGLRPKSIVPVMLYVKEEVVGLLIVGSRALRQYSEEELQLLTSIGQQIAIGIENARLYDATQKELTERKQAEEALKESEEKYRVLTESSPNGIFISDAKRIVLVNQRLCEITGFTSDELLNMTDPMGSLIASEDRERLLGYARNRLKGGAPPISYEARGIRKDGEEISLKFTVSTIVLSGTMLLQGTVEDITERKQAEEQINASLKEKEVMLQEIHHRVKNNLQIISSLLNLQAVRIKDKKSRELFNDSWNRVHSMALLHEKLYQSKDMAKVDFSSYLRSLVNSLYQSFCISSNQVSLNIKVKDVRFGIDQAVPCGLIINELVSNSLKYAFPKKIDGRPKIDITLR